MTTATALLDLFNRATEGLANGIIIGFAVVYLMRRRK